jgi:hypothetical protein
VVEKEEVEYLIEKEKNELRDYLRICHNIGLPQTVIDKRIDFYLDNLSIYFKQLENLKNSVL